jgi:cellulose synthase operon protein C
LKYFLKISNSRLARTCWTAGFVIALGWLVSARATLPSWIRNVEAGSAIEAALFRTMSLPGGAVLFHRPPAETRPALGELIKAQPHNAELYSLRALEDEQQLDFMAAELDWKKNAENAVNKSAAEIALADFYRRRLRPLEEIQVLSEVANAIPDAAEALTPSSQQRSWHAFERIFGVIQVQGLPADVSEQQYRAWLRRYPQEPALYARFLEYLLMRKDYSNGSKLIAEYRRHFPADQIFPIKAQAMLEYQRGSIQQGLAVYERTFQPLWAPELVKSYFDLLSQTQSQRKFLDQARMELNRNPDDANAMARVFYYYQQQGKLDSARQTVAAYWLHKESSKSEWRGQDLYICARLLEDIHAYPESARYYFALYNSKDLVDAQEQALAALTRLLLTAPESPIQLGSGDLSMYRDIATMDQGPGYLNGILSLVLNTTAPGSKFAEEQQRALPYFHRSRAAELLNLLDTKFPNAAARPELHSALLQFYSNSAQSDAVIHGGKNFLANFPDAPQRTSIALLIADAYARTDKTQEEFAIYDSVLQELAIKAHKLPLRARPAGEQHAYDDAPEARNGEQNQSSVENTLRQSSSMALQLSATPVSDQAGTDSSEYSRVLERYLARLVQLKQVPQALAVLRREIDRNPDDPGLYERLAIFLEQNRLGTEQEEVYRRALARFPDRSWYDKLARFYLRYKRNTQFESLTHEAVKTFSGTDLEKYFADVGYGGTPALYLRLNQYANQRFPHNPTFVRNLLGAYHDAHTYDDAAWERLLRQHWFEEPDLRSEFFEHLSANGELESEMSSLRPSEEITESRSEEMVRTNPAVGEFIAQADLWRSHFEDSASVLRALAEQYPADPETAHTASAVFRSLASSEPSDTEIAANIEARLLQANPGSREIMARIGDIYADRDQFGRAANYWDRIPATTPGEASSYLEAASIYWDYFDFDNALRLLNDGRKRLGDQNLYSYESGAIYENQRDYQRAIIEYIKGALAAGANSPADLRLLELGRRPKLRDLVDRETAAQITLPNPAMSVVDLRIRVLDAQNRKVDLEKFLESVVKVTTSIEQAEQIELVAQQKSLETVRQHALEKQADLTTDPVNRLQLRYRLVQLYETRSDFVAARRNIDALYQNNSRLLGVVRSTVDFYWRTGEYSQAIAILLQASKDAYPELSKQFAFEAARKSTDSGQYLQARNLLATLLNNSPYDGQYLAAMADTYARSGDDQGLRQFYLEKIALFRNASFSGDERKTRIATLRRGLIPALNRTKDYSGAMDQYIELINNFPEDAGLVTEAALYALRYEKSQQLSEFYSRTLVQSPRDYHWPMVLAQIQTTFEQYPAAIGSFSKAITVRPDRVDLWTARAELELRLMNFDGAASDYEHVYQLAFKDPKWMEKVAEMRARQGRSNDVVAALKTALIDANPENAGNYFTVAQRLESWGFLAEARGFAEKGIDVAGDGWLSQPQQHSGAKTYARVMTRLRQQETAYAKLQSALSDSTSVAAVLKEQVVSQGIAAITDKEWRARTRENRIRTARAGMRAALDEMGTTVATYFTPEEKLGFNSFLVEKRPKMNPTDADYFAIPLAQNAGLADLEAGWRYQLMMENGAAPNVVLSRMAVLIELQSRRLKFRELGAQLEELAPRIPAQQRYRVWSEVQSAYQSAGDPDGELRAFAHMPRDLSGSEQQTRLFELLLAHNPNELLQRAAQWTAGGQNAADYVVANGSAALAHSLISLRGGKRTPVWSKAYNALAGLYFAEASPDVNSAFLSALRDETVAARLAKPVDRSEQLAGNIWFYYGSRYGEYAALTRQDNPEDFLPAMLEQSPELLPATRPWPITIWITMTPLGRFWIMVTRSSWRPAAQMYTIAWRWLTTNKDRDRKRLRSGNKFF